MSKIKSLIDYDVKENIDYSAICVKFAMMSKQIENKDKEIERLNNIINELEKDIKNLYTYGIKNNAEQRDYLLNRLEGLKELKGEDKE